MQNDVCGVRFEGGKRKGLQVYYRVAVYADCSLDVCENVTHKKGDSRKEGGFEVMKRSCRF